MGEFKKRKKKMSFAEEWLGWRDDKKIGALQKQIQNEFKWYWSEGEQSLSAFRAVSKNVLEIVEDAKKNLLKCKTYDELREEIERWFGNE